MFWEDELQVATPDAESFYMYFAELFLNAIPVPGEDCVLNLRDATFAMFDFESTEEGVRLHNCFALCDEGKASQVQQALAQDRTWLCRGTSANSVLAPYEGNYTKSGSADTNAIARAKDAYARAKVHFDSSERADYLGLELAFAAYLAEMEQKDAEHALSWRMQRAQFAADHLAWVPWYCEKAASVAKTDFFRVMLLILGQTLG